MHHYRKQLLALLLISLSILACSLFGDLVPQSVSTPIRPIPVQPGAANPNEPVLISGTIPFTSPFFINTIAEPFVLLEDQAGFVARDREFEFPLASQVMGPVDLLDETTLSYTLSLPAVPAATMIDVDNDDKADPGVMIFGVAYWSNTWGDPFLEARDGTGWSNAYTSVITDPNRNDEIKGGKLIIWAPDDQQGFPSGFGADGLLFTEDDPITLVPAGYSIVDLDQDPFQINKEAQPVITLVEGEVAVNDFSRLSYAEAFEAFFAKASREYPFTVEKGVDWDELYAQFASQVGSARNDKDFYRALWRFCQQIPDGHIGLSIDPDIFYEEHGGGFGLVLTELSDGRVLVTQVLPGYPAAEEGIKVGAELVTWDNQPIQQAIRNVLPYFGPYSTEHHKRLDQAIFLTRIPPNTKVTFSYRNPGDSSAKEVTLTSVVEYDSLFASLPYFNVDALELPIVGMVLEPSGLGCIRLTTFSDDYNLLARIWERYIENLIDNEVPGLILDLRSNGGGSGGLAMDFAGYLIDEEILLSENFYFNDLTGEFERRDIPSRLRPAPLYYDGMLAILVGPNCASACEGFAHALSQGGRSIIVGHFPTAGMYGEVGRGQYELPADISLQFPTGRPETPDGKLLIEGEGVIPDILVPVTQESALGLRDTVLEKAIQMLLDRIGP